MMMTAVLLLLLRRTMRLPLVIALIVLVRGSLAMTIAQGAEMIAVVAVVAVAAETALMMMTTTLMLSLRDL